jgi:hypothetical protein
MRSSSFSSITSSSSGRGGGAEDRGRGGGMRLDKVGSVPLSRASDVEGTLGLGFAARINVASAVTERESDRTRQVWGRGAGKVNVRRRPDRVRTARRNRQPCTR